MKESIGEYYPIEGLQPHPKNPRHNEDAVEEVARSIKRFGFASPIIAREQDKTIIAGHTRWKAAKQIGLSKVPVVFMNLSVTDAEMLMIADNKLGEKADWDQDKLSELLSELKEQGEDLDALGFEPSEMDDLIGGLIDDFGFGDGEGEQEVFEDDYEPVSKKGEIYHLGEHRLMCGDSTVKENWDLLMEGEEADMVFTDPPYGMFLETDYDKMFSNDKNHKKTGNRFNNVIGDHEDFTPDLITIIFEIFPKVKEMFLWGADYYSEHLKEKNKGSWVVWDKRCSENMDKVLGNTFELCWSKKKHKRLICRELWSGHHGMGKIDTKRHHPTQKPIKLGNWFFDKYGKEGDIVVDFYGGSGMTLLSCQQMNRKSRLMELDPKYCDVIRKRWAKFAKDNNLPIGDGLE